MFDTLRRLRTNITRNKYGNPIQTPPPPTADLHLVDDPHEDAHQNLITAALHAHELTNATIAGLTRRLEELELLNVDIASAIHNYRILDARLTALETTPRHILPWNADDARLSQAMSGARTREHIRQAIADGITADNFRRYEELQETAARQAHPSNGDLGAAEDHTTAAAHRAIEHMTPTDNGAA